MLTHRDNGEQAKARLKAWRSIGELLAEFRNLAQSRFDDALDDTAKQPQLDAMKEHLPECSGLLTVAQAASQVLAAEQAILHAQEAYVDALEFVHGAAWDAYWDCESP